MIKVTRLNNSQLWVNAEFLKYIEETPDTILTLTTNDKLVVKESAEDLIAAVIAYRAKSLALRPKVITGPKGLETINEPIFDEDA